MHIMHRIVGGFPARAIGCYLAAVFCLLATGSGTTGWTDLIGEHGFDAWRKPTGDWIEAGDARPKPTNDSRLVAEKGHGVLVNGVTGRTRNLLTKSDYGDVEAHFEFQIPKRSNSGVKFESLYEIQISDSYGVARPTAEDCGGIYPRAELLPRYRHIDEGVPPRANATLPAGAWQTLDVIFRAPRFDSSGKKIKNARFDKVVLNGKVIHEDVELKTPTGHAWRLKEVARGPILLRATTDRSLFAKSASRFSIDEASNLLLLSLLLPVPGPRVQLDALHS
jgi:hypothetical protein